MCLGAGVRLEGFESRCVRGLQGYLYVSTQGLFFLLSVWEEKERDLHWSMLLLFAYRFWGK